MHARLTPVSSSSDSADSTCPARPDLQAPQAPATSSPAAAFASADRSVLLTAPAVDPAAFDAVPDRRGTASLKWDSAVKRGRPEDVLPLWVADMDHATAPAVTSALLWRTRHGIFGYSEPDDAYRAALTGWFSRRYGWQVEAEWNTVIPGVVPALALAVRALTAPGEAVLIEEPVYYPFRDVVEVNERTVAAVPLVRDADGVYRRDLAALEETIAATGARLLLLCNPHNPVGRVWSREELAALEEVTARHGVVVVADEIHADLALPGCATTPFASLSEAAAAHTITCTSPSKSFNLAGLQVANILISDARLRRAFRRELATTGYSQPNTLGLTACRAAYESGDAWLDALREQARLQRRLDEPTLWDPFLAAAESQPGLKNLRDGKPARAARSPRWHIPLMLFAAAAALLLWQLNDTTNHRRWYDLTRQLAPVLQRSQYLGDIENIPAESLAIYCQALQQRIDRDDAGQLATLARCYARDNQYRIAADIYARARRLNPGDDALALDYAQTRLFAHPGEAMPADVETILRRQSSQNPLAKILLAAGYTQSDKKDLAAPLWAELRRELAPDHPLYRLIPADGDTAEAAAHAPTITVHIHPDTLAIC